MESFFRDRDGLSDRSNGVSCIDEFGVVFVYEGLHCRIEEADGLCQVGRGGEEVMCCGSGDQVGGIECGVE